MPLPWPLPWERLTVMPLGSADASPVCLPYSISVQPEFILRFVLSAHWSQPAQPASTENDATAAAAFPLFAIIPSIIKKDSTNYCLFSARSDFCTNLLDFHLALGFQFVILLNTCEYLDCQHEIASVVRLTGVLITKIPKT